MLTIFLNRQIILSVSVFYRVEENRNGDISRCISRVKPSKVAQVRNLVMLGPRTTVLVHSLSFWYSSEQLVHTKYVLVLPKVWNEK